MRRIEALCRNICHDADIEEQISDAQSSGIITSYRLTSLITMNARRDANLCLWCDEIWYANHLHGCSYAPDYNCMFTCGKEFEVFAFVKVSKRGLQHLPVKEVRDEVQCRCADNMFDEMHENELEALEGVEAKNGPNDTPAVVHQVFDEISEPNLCLSRAQEAVVDDVYMLDEMSREHHVLNELSQTNLSSDTLVAPVHNENGLIPETGEIQVGSYEKVEQKTERIQYSVESICEVAECNVRHTSHETFKIRRRMIAKLSKLEAPYFHDLVILGARCERFSTLTSVLRYCRVSDKLPRDASKHNSSIFQVNVKPFVLLPKTRFPRFNENVEWLLVINRNCFMSPSFSMISGVSVHSLRTFGTETGRETFLNFKELHSWGFSVSSSNYPLPELSIERLIVEEFVGEPRAVLNKCALNIRVFDPGGCHWGEINVSGFWKSGMLGFVFDRGPSYSSMLEIVYVEIVLLLLCCGETSWLFGDNQLVNRNVVMMITVSAMGLVIADFCVKALIISHTLGDKGDFEDVGNDYVRIIRLRTSILNVAQSRAVSLSISPPSNTRSQCISAPTLTSGYDVCTLASRVLPHAACKTILLLAPTTVVPQSLQILIAHWHVFTTPFMWPSLVYSSDVGKMKSLTLNASKSSTFVFDPGGNNNALKMCGPQVRHCDSKRPPKAMGYENHQSYVFDPGGSVMIFEVNDATESRPKYVLDVSYRLLVFFDP